MLADFKTFILRGNVVDLTVGFIVGAAFTGVVRSLVTHLLTPPLSLLVGEIDLTAHQWVLRAGDPPPPYFSPQAAREAGAVTLDYGLFVDELISFLLVGFVVFLVVRGINRMERKRTPETPSAPTTRECPLCTTEIPIRARRCPACTGEVPAETGA